MNVLQHGHHKCGLPSFDPVTNEERQCCDGIHGVHYKSALDHITEHRKNFLSMSSKQRSLHVFNQLRLKAMSPGAVAKQIEYIIQPDPDTPPREVCRLGFLEYWPISLATLKRLELKKRLSISYYKEWTCERVPMKELHIIAWWLDYAEQTAERLPDQEFLITPCRQKSDLHEEFKADMAKSGHTHAEIAKLGHFCSVFKEAPELRHIQISALKRNFSRCSVCVELEETLQHALRGHDMAVVDHTKTRRINHLGLARADKRQWRGVRAEP